MIPLVDLRAQYARIKDEVDAAVGRVLASGQFVLGSEVAAFEEEFAGYCGVPFGVAVNSGTSALHLALLVAGVGPGDEVVTVPFTFVATTAAIVYTGARPVFIDVEPVSLTMDVTRVEGAITPRTKAIVPVHLYGQPVDMDPLVALARRRGLVVIEDAAQAHGAEYRGRRAGGLGDLACFSFYPGKNLGAYGEGGMVLTADGTWARRLRMLRDWGQDTRYHHVLKGYNYRMDALQAAILRVKLRHLETWTEARRAHAARYDRLLEAAGVEPVLSHPYARHVYHLYVVRADDRDALQRRLRDHAIHTGIHYPVPVHLQGAYADLGYGPGDFPVSEAAAARVLSLPLYPELSDDQATFVRDTVRAAQRSPAGRP